MQKYMIPIAISFPIILIAIYLVSITPSAIKVPFPTDLNSCDMLLFTTQTCPYCKAARQFLNTSEVSINWCEIDINQSAKGYRLFQQFSGQGVPLAIIGDERIEGFSQRSYHKAINSYQEKNR